MLLAILLTPLVAFLLSVRQTERFEASAQVLISYRSLGSALTDVNGGSSVRDPAQLALTEVTLAESPAVVSSVVVGLDVPGLTDSGLRASSDVSASDNADILTFTVEAEDRAFAASAANTYAREYIEYRNEIEERSIVQAQFELGRRLQALRDSGAASFQLQQTLVEQDDDLEAFRLLRTPRALLVGDAAQEVRQSFPHPRRDVLVALGFGLLLAVSLMWLREVRDRTYRSGDEVARALGTTLLGSLPPPDRMMVHDAAGSRLLALQGPLDERLVLLRESTRFALGQRDARVALLTTASSYENRSVVVASLALALARSGLRVAIVDADPATPSITQLLNLPATPTLDEVVSGRVPLSDALTSIAATLSEPAVRRREDDDASGELSVLRARSRSIHPGDLFTSSSVSDVVHRLESDFDVVLISAPPVGSGSLAVALSATADALILIARLNVLRAPELEELRSVLALSPAARIGTIATGTPGRGSPATGRRGRQRPVVGPEAAAR